MQCYEGELMRAYMHKIATFVDPGFKRDDLLLSDMLVELGAETLEQLIELEQVAIKKIVAHYHAVIGDAA